MTGSRGPRGEHNRELGRHALGGQPLDAADRAASWPSKWPPCPSARRDMSAIDLRADAVLLVCGLQPRKAGRSYDVAELKRHQSQLSASPP